MKELGPNKRTAEFLTTGQIAAYCGVNFRTVIRWIKKGILQAQRLPGRGDRRVSRTHFLEFLEKNQLSVPEDFQIDESSDSKESLSTEPRSLRVLIVDDDRVTASAIQRVLKLHGYETQMAHDGFEAGRFIESFGPSLITLDLLMQGIDGIAVLKTLKNEKKLSSIKVVVISADKDSKIQQALELGASKALKKPFNNKELIATVAGLIGEVTVEKSHASEQ